MGLSVQDQQLVANMKERELHIKKRQRAANMIVHETRQYQRMLIAAVALAGACVAAGVYLSNTRSEHGLLHDWHLPVLVAVAGAVIGVMIGQGLLRTRPGRRLIARKQARLHRKYSGDLHAGRRWMQFFFQGEDISCYVGQILYVLESERRFDSVREALAFVKKGHHANTLAQARALRHFNAVAAQTDLVVVSSVAADGIPSSRLMRFVTTDRPGVWYVTSAPETPKIPELEQGTVALLTVPTEDGATISINRVRIRRSGKAFMDVAGLYQAQVPGYLDGMTEEEQHLEVVYELTLQSARSTAGSRTTWSTSGQDPVLARPCRGREPGPRMRPSSRSRYHSGSGQRTSKPVAARPISMRWISLAPPTMVKTLAVRAARRQVTLERQVAQVRAGVPPGDDAQEPVARGDHDVPRPQVDLVAVPGARHVQVPALDAARSLDRQPRQQPGEQVTAGLRGLVQRAEAVGGPVANEAAVGAAVLPSRVAGDAGDADEQVQPVLGFGIDAAPHAQGVPVARQLGASRLPQAPEHRGKPGVVLGHLLEYPPPDHLPQRQPLLGDLQRLGVGALTRGGLIGDGYDSHGQKS